MGELVEKITLYDLLGYTLPGGVVVVSVLKTHWTQVEKFLAANKDYGFYIFVVLFAASFLTGVMISEVAAWVVNAIKCIMKKIMGVFEGSAIQYSVSRDDVMRAIRNAGIDVGEDVQSADLAGLLDSYYGYMYDDLQRDRAYSRVHNYASAETMYKNMGLSSLLCILVLRNETGIFRMVLAGGIASSLIFMVRWGSFSKKKKRHVVHWFVNKYKGNGDGSETGEREQNAASDTEQE